MSDTIPLGAPETTEAVATPIPANGAITDAHGNVWSITATGVVAVNGVPDATTASVVELALVNGLVWKETAGGIWQSKALPTDTWSTATTTGPLPATDSLPPSSPPSSTPSPNNTAITASGGSIIDLNSNVWTLVKGQVAVNGTVDATTASVIEMAFVNGHVWQENNQSLWWAKVLPTDAWTPTAGTSINPLPVLAKPTLTLTTAAGASTVIAGSAVAVAHADGCTVTVSDAGDAKVVFGKQSLTLTAVAMTSLIVTGGTAACSAALSSGKNTINLGSGALDVTTGGGADNYHYSAGNGLLTIETFNAAQGDTLTIATALKASMKSSSDGKSGTSITFGSAAKGIEIKNLAPSSMPTIVWS
jgi:hypothetical protein